MVAAALGRGLIATGHWSLSGLERPAAARLRRLRHRLLSRERHPGGRAGQAARGPVGPVPRGIGLPRHGGARAAAHLRRGRPAARHVHHRRRGPRFPARARAPGQRGPRRHRARRRPGAGHPGRDGRAGRVPRPAARHRLDRPGTVRRHPVRRRPERLPPAPGAGRRGGCGRGQPASQARAVGGSRTGRIPPGRPRVRPRSGRPQRGRPAHPRGRRREPGSGRSAWWTGWCPPST